MASKNTRLIYYVKNTTSRNLTKASRFQPNNSNRSTSYFVDPQQNMFQEGKPWFEIKRMYKLWEQIKLRTQSHQKVTAHCPWIRPASANYSSRRSLRVTPESPLPSRFTWFAASAERKCEITTPGMAGDAVSWRISWNFEFHNFLNIFSYFSIFFVIFQYSNVFFRILYRISCPGVVLDSSDMKNIEKSIFHV